MVETGIRGTTLERVAARAGVSKGVVLHYFKDKDALFVAVMRRANKLLADGVVELLRHADTPVERLLAVIVGNFSEPVFSQKICHAWINLCADAPYNAENLRIQSVIHARMRSNLLNALRKTRRSDDIELLASQISALIDGIWLRASLRDEPMSTAEGMDCIVSALGKLLGAASYDEIVTASQKMQTLAELILRSKAFTEKSFALR